MKIGVIGVGNIGMRYVQGISSTFPEAHLYLVDSRARLHELSGYASATVSLCASLDEVEEAMDLFVVATSCEPRLSLYKQCLARNPRYVILEKYLFNSRAEFEECLSLPRAPTFVNQWMYGSGAFDCLFETEATRVEVRGSGWGLACNAVHWMDVMKRHMNMTRLEVGPGTRVTDVFASKRAGYEELYGEFVFVDKDSDKSFRLVDLPDNGLVGRMEIEVDARVYEFDFTTVRHNETVLSSFPYFSSQVGGIVGSLMDHGRCQLPDLEESVSQHLLIEDILGELAERPAVT